MDKSDRTITIRIDDFDRHYKKKKIPAMHGKMKVFSLNLKNLLTKT